MDGFVCFYHFEFCLLVEASGTIDRGVQQTLYDDNLCRGRPMRRRGHKRGGIILCSVLKRLRLGTGVTSTRICQ